MYILNSRTNALPSHEPSDMHRLQTLAPSSKSGGFWLLGWTETTLGLAGRLAGRLAGLLVAQALEDTPPRLPRRSVALGFGSAIGFGSASAPRTHPAWAPRRGTSGTSQYGDPTRVTRREVRMLHPTWLEDLSVEQVILQSSCRSCLKTE